MGALARLASAAFAGLLLLALPAMAAENILSFTSNLVLATDGGVDVHELLTVNVENDRINHGIYRDIPVVLVDDQGNKVRPELEVLGVTRDGVDEPYRTEREGNFLRIYIGDAEVTLPPGAVHYDIHYSMDRMGRFFADHDEIYWNATGNYWDFSILTAAATVTLPTRAVISEVSGYTGAIGSKERNVQTTRTDAGTVLLRTTAPLAPGEGMSYAVSFQNGILAEPAGLTKVRYWFEDRQDSIIPSIGALLTLGFFSFAWTRVGRDPKTGVIIPRFHPPDGLHPGLVHYIANWGFRKDGWTAFTAAIFDLGVKGLVSIDNSGALKVSPTGQKPEAPLPADEAAVYDYVMANDGFTIDKSTGPTLASKKSEFTAAIASSNKDVWFRNNFGYSAIGIVIALAMLGLMVMADYLDIGWLILAAVAGVVILVLANVGHSLLKGGIFGKLMVVFWIGVLGFNVLGAAVSSISTIQMSTAAIAAASIIGMTLVFVQLMRAPTMAGRQVMDQIDGFKMYLNTAEKHRLNMEKEPPMSVSRFEAILPFAIALEVERAWSSHFDALLARNAVEGVAAGGYVPLWYAGGYDFSSSTIANTVSAAAGSMSAAMVAAQPVQSSSSGGGGGGSSGGGGGGGGGGGW